MLLPRCNALFIDEAQDMGPSTLKLLLSIIERADVDDPHSQSAHIFYDNEQNIYDRKTPNWSELGIDLRGRSIVMRESFRSTIPITELAINVVRRLTSEKDRHDPSEMLRLGLIENTERNGEPWLRVRFNQIQGPVPTFDLLDNRTAELDALFQHLTKLIQIDGISASDICLIYNSQWVADQLTNYLAPKLLQIGIELSVQTRRSFERRENTLLVTTSHSYKGYESEVVIIPCVDQFVATDSKILANNLYVAMTRARSLLALFGVRYGSTASRQITQTVEKCVELMNWQPQIDLTSSIQDDLNDLLEQLGAQHRDWLVDLWKRFKIRQEPLYTPNEGFIAQPLFWFRIPTNTPAADQATNPASTLACFGSSPLDPNTAERLSRNSVQLLTPGQIVLPGQAVH